MWLEEVLICHYYWSFAMKANGINLHHISLFVISSLLLYAMHFLPLFLLHTTFNQLVLLQLLHVFLVAGDCQLRWLEPQTTTILLCLFFCFGSWYCFLFYSPWSYSVKVLFLLNCLILQFVIFGTSTCLAHASTCSFVTTLVSSKAVSLYIISVSSSLSFKPWMNCFFSCLSIS